MNGNERELVEGLRALAGIEPREASPHVEQALLEKFRARRERRRLVVWGSVGTAAAVAATIAMIFWAWAPESRQAARETTSTPQDAMVASSAASDDLANSFYPLPETDDLPPVETNLVVRVQMPVSSLRLMGFPIDEDLAAEPVQADVLLGQDGLARGVRLVQ